MSITDELRLFAADPYTGWVPTDKQQSDLRAIADRIDAEHERAMADAYLSGTPTDEKLTELGWIRLPKDADGEYIRIGDVMEWCDSGDTLEVIGIGDDTLFYIDPEGDRTYAEWTSARNKRHYHAPTVEDVLTEMVAKVIERGELTNGAAQTIADYAAKLRLAKEDA